MIQTVGGNRWLWVLLSVAFVVRLGLAVGVQHIVSQTPGRLDLIPGDVEGYWALAGKLAAGEDYSFYEPPRRLMRMPGFPLLLAIPRFIAGDQLFVARLLLVAVGTLAVGLTYWLGRELAGDPVGIIAGFYTALSPIMALFSVLFLSETAFAASLLASLIVAAKLVRHPEPSSGSQSSIRFGPPLPLLTGVFVGLATYMRPTWLLVGPGLAALLILFRARSRSFANCGWHFDLRRTWVVPVSWTIRNFYVTGHFVQQRYGSAPVCTTDSTQTPLAKAT